MKGEKHLTRPAEYERVYKEGGSWASGTLVMKAVPNGLALSRYGFSVSRRVGGAVVRNKVKRRLREILRVNPLRPGWDIVFIARPPVAGARFSQVSESVRGLLSRAQLLMKNNEEVRLKAD